MGDASAPQLAKEAQIQMTNKQQQETQQVTQQEAQALPVHARNGANGGGLLNREGFLALAAKPRTPVRVDLPWIGPDAHAYVRPLTNLEYERYEASITTMRGESITMNFEGMRARLLARSICTPDGKELLFNADNLIDIDTLGSLDSRTARRLYDVVMEASGIGGKDLEEIAKNSERVRSSGF